MCQNKNTQSKAVTSKDVAGALCPMKAGRACGEDCLYAEMLKTQRQGLIDTIAIIFTDILHGKVEAPAAWCKSRLAILYKKGDR